MKITARFSGSCAHCGATWVEGDTIEHRKDHKAICVTCAAAGKLPPTKDGAPSKNPTSASPASAPALPDVRALLEAALRIEKVLAQILTELRSERRPAQAQAAQSADVPANESEVPF